MALQGNEHDTIAAIATPYGESGIGIVRLSGPQAKRIAERIFRPRSGPRALTSHHIRYGEIVDPAQERTIDEVLLTFMAAPKTYTREDVVEINCHGGFGVLRRVLEVVLQGGAREALPGEFTKRAFLSGRIDLAQAEAVLDIIQAKTDEGLRLAEEQLRGRLTQEVAVLHEELLGALVTIEAYIDFPEEDIDSPSTKGVVEVLHHTLAQVEGLIGAYEDGEIYRDGVKAAIVGKTNVGKSSLLNQLLERERAIVTAVPGTTTDVIEEAVNLSGVLIRLMDMAGLREPRNEVEREGIRLARGKLSEAHLIILVVDRSRLLDDEDRRIFREVQGKRTILVLNKIDLPPCIEAEEVKEETGIKDLYPLSALRGDGIEELKRGIVGAVVQGGTKRGGGDLVPVNLRHKRVLEKAKGLLEEALEGRRREIPWDLTAIEIRQVLNHLGEIVGVTTPEEVLEMVFSRFCIGK
ncbi:MAG: tRNA uridine-5-carboxymethylaminomethyl(34) synthesis GTPase MnmE [Deltaproteobacteria bacterium RBG_16_54_11]|nr:MAG: tRNA uridine-5-carboxymethylaminomethyl(34) synthesis GTPase MnmE [Deltaproteobacteria bacterium RBG_16_54_11]